MVINCTLDNTAILVNNGNDRLLFVLFFDYNVVCYLSMRPAVFSVISAVTPLVFLLESSFTFL